MIQNAARVNLPKIDNNRGIDDQIMAVILRLLEKINQSIVFRSVAVVLGRRDFVYISNWARTLRSKASFASERV